MSRRVRRGRRGFAMAAMLALLAVALLGVSLLVQKMAAQERAMRGQAQKLQAQVLAESALDRAAAKLSGNREYQGETWQPTVSGAPANAQTARVVIAVQPGQGENEFEVTVTSQFPDHPTRRAQVVTNRQLRISN